MFPKYSCFLACWLSVFLLRGVLCTFTPSYSDGSAVGYEEQSRAMTFPDFSVQTTCTPDKISYFISEQNFDDVRGKILVGAADKLYLLSDSLQCQDEYRWDVTTTNVSSCLAIEGSDQARICRNHIRIFKSVPSDSTLILTCGTQASITPQCRTVRVTDTGLTVTSQAPVTVSDAFVSYYPKLSGFGEFTRNPDNTNTSFFAAGYSQTSPGQEIGIYNVNSLGSSTLSVTESFKTVLSEFWLKEPVTFVDYYRADYPQPEPQHRLNGGTPASDNYQFYFVFFRESLVGASVQQTIYSRVARICRNDPGVDGHFSTFMKSRIFCNRQAPSAREFFGALDYQYSSIESVVFNDNGRFSENGAWSKKMYGAFSGSLLGPEGTAICAYPADNSLADESSTQGYNRGIFDVFREDLISIDGNGEVENTYFECDAGGRSAADSNLVQIVRDVEQIDPDPLLVIDGVTVKRISVDMACIIRSSNPIECRNQDVLFLGTDDGTVLKVVFATLEPTGLIPVIAETINLENTNEIYSLNIRSVDSERFIFITTDTHIYRLPLERCSRFQTCDACVGARDPYCVWDNNVGGCVKNPLSAINSQTASVQPGIWQNVHTGHVSLCNSLPECVVTAFALSYNRFTCEIQCNDTGSVSFSADDSNLAQANCQGSVGSTLSNGEACVQYTGGYGLQTHQCIVSTTTTQANVGPTVSDTVIMPAGPPAPLPSDNIYYTFGTTSFQVCIQPDLLTDSYENYQFSVEYGSSGLVDTSADQSLIQNRCLTVEGLTTASALNFRVTICNSINCFTTSTFSKRLLEDRPEAVTLLMSTAITSRSVSLSWQTPSITNGVITGYTILVDGVKEITCVIQPSLTYTVDGLLPFTQYSFEIRACTGAGESQTSDILSVTTECEAPGTVSNITFSGISSTQMTVEWTQPSEVNGNPNELQYQVNAVCLDPVNGQNLNTATPDPAATSLTFSGLKPLTFCCVTVNARHGSCSASSSGAARERCSQTMDGSPNAVQNFNLDVIGPTSMFARWNLPGNYQRPGLTYNLNIASMGNPDRNETVTNVVYFLIEDLTPNTQYTVTISASTVQNVGNMSAQATNTTLPLSPSAPESPSLSLLSPEILTFSWTPPQDSSTHAPIIDYIAVLRCNGVELLAMTTPSTMVDISVAGTTDLTWCTAVVQGSNQIGVSNYSPQANIVIPARLPTKPQCFYTATTGAIASISFTVTYPFSLNQTSINYTVYQSGQPISTNMTVFHSNSLNVVKVPIERETLYQFQLSFCNEYGCGEYSDMIEFTTPLTFPSPPDVELFSVERDCCSANVSWPFPPNEVEGTVLYSVQLTSSCAKTNLQMVNTTRRWYLFTGLCADIQYSLVIQVAILSKNITGLYSRPYVFHTESGAPSEVRYIEPYLTRDEKVISQLIVTWFVPLERNGSIVVYEVSWSNSTITTDCKKPDGSIISQNITDLSVLEIKTDNVSNIATAKSLLICVRAYTRTHAGVWGSYRTADFNVGELLLTDGCSEPCPSLITVAVIASVAVLSSIILGLVLIIVLFYNRWTLVKHTKQLQEQIANQKLSESSFPRAYHKSLSEQSTSSQTPILNGK